MRINAGRGKEERFTARNITKTLRDMTVTPAGRYCTGNFDSSDTVRALQELTDMKFNCGALSPARMRQNIRNSKKFCLLHNRGRTLPHFLKRIAFNSKGYVQ